MCNLKSIFRLSPKAIALQAFYSLFPSKSISPLPTHFSPKSTFENIHRVIPTQTSSPLEGKVTWSPSKSLFIGTMNIGALVAACSTFSLDAFSLFLGTTAFTLCFGHSLGMHRRLIHNSYECPAWLEKTFVYLGTLIGMAGPYGMVRTHDMRDWAQRQPECHDYFCHRRGMLQDAIWQMHCELQLKNPPEFKLEPRIAEDKFYKFLEKTWQLQQVPWAVLFYLLGGWNYVLWGVCMRVSVSVGGHWLVGYFAHREGHKNYHVEGAAVQGYNVTDEFKFLSLASFGESYHNNHHAFPGSANFGIKEGEVDVGYKVLRMLEWAGLVKNIRMPEDLPEREELKYL